ncbi:MAG: hypothetical protein II038_10400 [Lachnospiraceae bacterium]|nr:hypothetical protein [Lachnospiraceae bacterium]
MFISDYFQLDEEQFDKMCSLGVFDALLDKDSNFFINIIRLKESTVPEFIDAYQHVNQYFNNIATLLDAADMPTMKDKMYRSARAMFRFHEVNGINLGFSKSRYGSGWGEQLSDLFCADAYQIVKKGSKQPELFHLVSLFEADVGPDRLSDMIATIIEPQIVQYTLRIMKELGITPETRPDLPFLENGLVQNPYKSAAILLLPTEVLHQLPIAKDWDDIDRVVTENNTIRQEVSAEVGAEWTRWASAEQKHYLKTHVFMDPAACSRVIDGYRRRELSALDLKEDTNYLVELLLKKLKKADAFKRKIEYPSSLIATRGIINIFKDWVENNRGWAEIQNAPSRNREKAVQRFMHLGAKNYVETHDLDISCEPDDGRGPVDIKISRGQDKTVAEVKLSSNGQYLHGYKTQIQEYGKAERTRNLFYVFVDIGHPGRRKALLDLHERTRQSGASCPELIIIDAQRKKAASTYDIDSTEIRQDDPQTEDLDKAFAELELTLKELPEIDWNDFPTIDLDTLPSFEPDNLFKNDEDG